MKLFLRPTAAVFVFAALASAQSGGVLGNWKTKAGSIVDIEHCGAQVCMRIVEVMKTGGATTDSHNPDQKLRSRALCGLEIGSGFTLTDASHATGGTLYDPKSGKTYRGQMSVDGATLHLRGYIGIPFFGASESWSRPGEVVRPCEQTGPPR